MISMLKHQVIGIIPNVGSTVADEPWFVKLGANLGATDEVQQSETRQRFNPVTKKLQSN